MKSLKVAAWITSGFVVLLIALTVAAVVWIHMIKPQPPPPSGVDARRGGHHSLGEDTSTEEPPAAGAPAEEGGANRNLPARR
jgi:hypothetical protein